VGKDKAGELDGEVQDVDDGLEKVSLGDQFELVSNEYEWF
jgi:hypothetical protein